jgi:hypothetical protein
MLLTHITVIKILDVTRLISPSVFIVNCTINIVQNVVVINLLLEQKAMEILTTRGVYQMSTTLQELFLLKALLICHHFIQAMLKLQVLFLAITPPNILPPTITPGIVLPTLTPDTLLPLLIPSTLLSMLTPNTLQSMLIPSTLLSMLTPKTLQSILIPSTLQSILIPSTLLSMLTPNTLLSMLTPNNLLPMHMLTLDMVTLLPMHMLTPNTLLPILICRTLTILIVHSL